MVTRFAGCELDRDLFELRRDGEVQKLEPKTFDMLVYLVDHRDRVVSKDELLEKCWRDEIVSESVLPSNVRTLRKALGDDRTGQRFIQTVYGRGYRFVATVEAEAPDPSAVVAAGDAADTTADTDAAAHADAVPFVGRTTELAHLRDALDRALGGHGAVALVVGEAGIGKTRIADEIAREARRRGARVLVGRCHGGEGAPAFWPWIQILRSAVAALTPERRRQELGGEFAEIAPLLPELGEPGAEGPVYGSEQGRFRLFDAIARYLRRAAAAQPLVIVLDDLHWADKASILLLRFLAIELRDAAALLVTTYRDEELHRGHALARVAGELAREPFASRLQLKGLARDEVGRFVRSFAPEEPSDDFIAQLHERTAGNPFFLRELVHLIGGDRSGAGILPEGIREAIGRRLDRLSDETNQLLTAAAFLGQEFSVALLERVADRRRPAVLECLDEALKRGVLSADPASPGRFAFAHALMRETLYQEVSTPLRARLHRRVGEALEEMHRDDPTNHLAELAYHFFQAAAGGEIDKAVLWGRRAAEHALELLAWEEAAASYQRVLDVLALASAVDERARCETLLALGDACARAGERERARAAFAEAGELARHLGDATFLARAALGIGGRAEEVIGLDEPLQRLLTDALGAVGESDLALRAALLARLAATYPYAATPLERARMSAEAVELARRSGARWALAQALFTYGFVVPQEAIAERLTLGAELIETANRPDDSPWGLALYDVAWVGHVNRHRTFLLAGDIVAADRELGAMARIATQQRQPYQRFLVCLARFGRAHAGGRFEEARQWIERTRAVATRLDPIAGTIDHVLEFLLARERGPEQLPDVLVDPDQGGMRGIPLDRLGWSDSAEAPSIADVRGAIRAASPWMVPLVGSIMGHVSMQLGRKQAARAELAALAEQLDDVAHGTHWLFTTCLASEIAVWLDDRACAERLYALLEPRAALHAVFEDLDVHLGSVAHFAGVLAAQLGERARAIAHLEEALERNQRMEARAHVLRTRAELAGALGKQGGARTRELREAAEAGAREIGMGALLARLSGHS